MNSAKLLSACLLAVLLAGVSLYAQTTTTGDLSGRVTDPTGAVLTDVTVTLTNGATGATQTTTTNSSGIYHFSLLQPASYTVSVSVPGFQMAEIKTNVDLGQSVTADVSLKVKTAVSTVQVTENGQAVQVENGDISTTFNSHQLTTLPNPGNDVTSYAQTAPGVTMNTQSGYGNFSSFGLPAASNLFTLDGQNDNDPYLNLNNSGATNLLLGSNEIAEVTVVNNGYSGQYGQLAGAQVNYVTKSGTNEYHGNANYYWNGRVLNANDFFNNATSTAKPFDNANQWATGGGGPIVKNKTFFFVNYEGLRVVIPTSSEVQIPSPQFQTATLANLMAVSPASVPFYQQIFKFFNSAPGAAGATPVAGGGCQTFTALGPGVPCTVQFRAAPGNFTHEEQWAVRVDQNLGNNDHLFARFQRDNGVQATYTDPLNPIFNAASGQPEWQSQLSETHTFGGTATNNFVASAQFYAAVFGPSNLSASLSAFPTTISFANGWANVGGDDFFWPEGRRVTQYQVVDDFSKVIGRHTLRFGVNAHRDNVTDLSFGTYTSGLITEGSLQDFYMGGGVNNSLVQAFPSAAEQPIELWLLGAYAEDDINVTSRLKLNLVLRIDHNSNPVCEHDCFARTIDPFTAMDHDPSIPYDQSILSGLHQAYPATDDIIWEPRIGFAWATSDQKTVVRGGAGIFGDSFPGTVVDDFAKNFPEYNSFTVPNAPISTAVPGNLFQIAASSNQSLASAFSSGGTLASISAANPLFSPPSFTSSESVIHQPRYYEWNLEIQHQLPGNLVFSANYVGNKGQWIPLTNVGPNFYYPGGAGGIPTSAPDPRFGVVTQIESAGNSNYNGLVVSIRKPTSHGLTFGANYTWSHAIDNVSNAGFLPFNYTTAESVLAPQNPYNYLGSRGNADYDVRHYFSANYVWEDAIRHLFHWGPNALFGGWTIGGTIFFRTGLPYTVIDGATTSSLQAYNYGGASPYFQWVFANPLVNANTVSCGKANEVNQNNPCMTAAQFGPDFGTTFFGGIQGRNDFRGPNFFDTDLSAMKYFNLGTERVKFGVGFEFFNLFNHPNFDLPVNDIANSEFGEITRAVSVPTSILGAFLGGDASPRIIEVKGTITF
jgi:Carboxypeptidase regulatory-like domain